MITPTSMFWFRYEGKAVYLGGGYIMQFYEFGEENEKT